MVRDSKGVDHASVSSNIPFLLKPVVAKALALFRALLLCEKMGLSQLCIEGEGNNVVHAASRADICSTEIEPIIFDIRYSLQHHLDWLLVVHVSCDCNQVAHALAKLTRKLFHDKVWVQTYPV